MAAIQANIIIGWPSTAASIPTGWTRETALDGRYIVGAATGADGDLTTDRGNATHTHTSPAHTPLMQAHTHNMYSTSGASGSQTSTAGSSSNVTTIGHQHAGPANAALATATNIGLAITVDAATNDLAYTKVIWIKSDGTPTALPAGCVAFFADDALPSGWSRTSGNQYLKGADTGGDGGSTGGSNTHTHTSPAHTHLQNAHSHDPAPSGVNDFPVKKNTTNLVFVAVSTHTHSLSLDSTTGTNQPYTTIIDASNYEPPFLKLNAVLASSPDLPTSIICLWGGSNASIPSGWSRYTGLDGSWHKCANANGESGITTGGAAHHTHTADDCLPTVDTHTHTVTDNGISGTVKANSSGAATFSSATHTHSWANDPDAGQTIPGTAVTIDACSDGAAYPPYRTVIFIQFAGGPSPPTVAISGQTSYDIQQWQSIEGKVLPEVAARIARGDRRFYPEAL